MTLIAVSVMAPVFDPLYRRAIACLAEHAGERITLLENVPWPERERMLRRGEADLGFICGLPYAEEADRHRPTLALMGAPVMAAPRYQGRPVYYSDVVVSTASPYRTFSDLRGARWAYNEPNSHSGCNVARWALASRGIGEGFFGRLFESGSHENTLRMLERGTIDGGAIDSTVLERILTLHPSLAPHLRVIATFGPSPMPPVVVGTHVPPERARRLREGLLSIAPEDVQSFGVDRFVEVDDRHYDPIRAMARESAGVRFLRMR